MGLRTILVINACHCTKMTSPSCEIAYPSTTTDITLPPFSITSASDSLELATFCVCSRSSSHRARLYPMMSFEMLRARSQPSCEITRDS
ncbi:hypothetical protein RSAG8_00585, partial [Rhizoctonia solani AG-8 WAC10335]